MAPSQKKKRPRGAKLTAALWDQLVEFWRRNPNGSPSKAAQLIGIDRRTAVKAFSGGLNYDFAKVPIADLLRQETMKARVALAAFSLEQAPEQKRRRGKNPDIPKTPAEIPLDDADGFKARELARADAIGARAAEALLVRRARGNVLGLLEATDHLVGAGRYLAQKAAAAILAQEDWSEMSREAIALVHEITKVARLVTASGVEVVEMERKLLGDPGDVSDPAAMSAEEAIATLEVGAGILERLKRRELVLADDGLAEQKNDPPAAPPPAESEADPKPESDEP